MAAVLRDACDACHRRKMRCPTDGVGACLNCRRTGQVCQYSPRCEMGRPRLNSPMRKRTRVRKGGKKTHAVAGESSVDAGSPHSTRASSPKAIAPLLHGKGMFAPSQDINRSVPEHPTVTSEAGPHTLFWDNTSVGPSLMSQFSFYDAPSWSGSTMGSSTASPTPTLIVNPNMSEFDPYNSKRQTNHGSHLDTETHVWNSDPSPYSPSSVLPTEPNGKEPVVDQKQSYNNSHLGLSDTTFMVPAGPNRFYEAYCQLSSILYALQTLSPYPSDSDDLASPITRDHNQHTRNIDRIFTQVLSLCKTVTWITANLPDSTSSNKNGDLDIVPFLLIITSLTTTISTIYTQRLEKYETTLRRGEGLTPSLQIQILTDATTMEFHLGQLGRVLMDASAQEICDSQTVAKLKGLRMSVKAFVDECRV